MQLREYQRMKPKKGPTHTKLVSLGKEFRFLSKTTFEEKWRKKIKFTF